MANKQIIRDFIQSELVQDEVYSLKDDDNLIETSTIDSLGITKLIVYLEKTFSIKISDEEVLPENFETVDAISVFVAGKQI